MATTTTPVIKTLATFDKEYKEYTDLYKDRDKNYGNMVARYYDFVTEFYEFGWGESFHFAPRHQLETHKQSLSRYEHFIANKLGLKEGMKVLDIGCGVGGPAREISRFTGAKLVGLNINELQVERAKFYTQKYGMQDLCNFVVGDFHKIPFPENTFDAVYCIEASCHSPHREKVFAEAMRVLKPGGRFLTTEYCLTNKYDPDNPEHLKVKNDLEYSNGLCDTTTCDESKNKMLKVGFKMLYDHDHGKTDSLNPVPWYQEFASYFTLSGITITLAAIWILYFICSILEFLNILPKGTTNSHGMLQLAGRSYLKGGQLGIYTVAYVMLGEKPKK